MTGTAITPAGPSTDLVHTTQVDQGAVLRTLGLDARDPNTQAVILICRKYDLDPLLKHVVLIKGRPYITRDGYLHHAHMTGVFDGIDIVDEGETPDYWWAKAAVYRKDMARPFTYRGRYPKRNAGNPQYGPEMAIKTAEVMALRRAFNISGLPAADEQWDTPEPEAPSLTPAAAKSRLLELAGGDRDAAVEAWKRAEIPDGTMVSVAQMAAAEDELRALGWAWSRPDDGYEAPSDGDADDDPGAAGAGNGDVPEHHDQPADTGRADMDTPAAPGNTSGQHGPPGLTPRQIAQRAEAVFAAHYVTGPRGGKRNTALIDRLRHALVYAQTGGAHTSTADVDPVVLHQVWQRLDDIAEGRMTYALEPDTGVTFTTSSGQVTVTWLELDGEDGDQ